MDTAPLMVNVESAEEATIKDDFCYRNNVAQAHVQIRLGNIIILSSLGLLSFFKKKISPRLQLEIS